MKMKIYAVVARLAWLDILEYRLDFLLQLVKYSGTVLMMSLVWLAVGRSNPAFALTTDQTVTYFVFASGLYSLSNFHTQYIEDDIRFGWLSKFLVKPLSWYWYYFSFQAAQSWLEFGLKLLIFIPLTLLIGFHLDLTPLNCLLFSIFLPCIFWCAFTMLSIISGLTFWTNEAWAIRWACTSIFRLLSGVFAPISLFPWWLQRISAYMPFQYLVYTPIQVIQNQLLPQEAVQALVVLLSWTLVLDQFRRWLWRRGLLNFEGNGL